MPSFELTYKDYIRAVEESGDSNFSIETMARAERVLGFLYQDWFKVDMKGLERLPQTGPVLIVGNAGGILPWAATMLMYALMSDKKHPRRLTVLADMDWIEDERLYNFLREIGFMPLNADNARRLYSEGQTVMVFPEGQSGFLKPFAERYRLRSFDWTILMPAVEAGVPVIPLATLGPEESFPVARNVEWLAKLLSLPAFPLTPFFPFLPFPANLLSIPVKWKMRVLKPIDYEKVKERDQIEETSKRLALFIEGEIQAEINRMLRVRVKPLF
jgi:1-acyl-sn-glycerol-3-phosphate acyltransferase